MPSDAEITEKFWHALKSDMTAMLGIHGVSEHMQPMTAQMLEGQDFIWFFTTRDNGLVADMARSDRAMMCFAAKSHDLFACVNGRLETDNDRATIDALWSPFAAAWYEGGKDDPNLQLIRLDPTSAQIWLNENSLFSGIKLLLGRDPKKDYQDKVAEVAL